MVIGDEYIAGIKQLIDEWLLQEVRILKIFI